MPKFAVTVNFKDVDNTSVTHERKETIDQVGADTLLTAAAVALQRTGVSANQIRYIQVFSLDNL